MLPLHIIIILILTAPAIITGNWAEKKLMKALGINDWSEIGVDE